MKRPVYENFGFILLTVERYTAAIMCPIVCGMQPGILQGVKQCLEPPLLEQLVLSLKNYTATVILQIFGVVLFSVFLVVNGFTKKTPIIKCKKTH